MSLGQFALSSTAARKKVYPRHTEGRFHSLRRSVSIVLQGLLFLAPWITWHGQQAILMDVAGRKLYLFGLVVQPQETHFLQLMLVSAAILLFASTAVAGRMWCGYACPQTLFTQSFIAVERFFEGDRAQRIRLDKAPWEARKIRIKLSKFATWLVMSLYLGFTFAGYYTPIRGLAADVVSGHPATSSLAIIGFFTAVSLFDFGWFREQFCNYLCPYARFQGSMMDSSSLIIGYDGERGEPRGKKSKQITSLPVVQESRGDCVDCTMCVQVCPQGIDIRNGLQLECIACAACIDACDDVMDKLDRPRGLIRYTSLNQLQGKRQNWLRPRVVVYAILLTLLGSAFVALAARRAPIGISIVRQAAGNGSNFAMSPDGRVTNSYKIHLINRTRQPQSVRLSLEGFAGGELAVPANPWQLAPGEVATVTGVVLHPPDKLSALQQVTVRASWEGGSASDKASFVAAGAMNR